jgi:putative phosphoribosyl transferase
MDDIRFKDRKEAGKELANQMSSFRGSNAVILAIPRGGVPVGFEIAKELQLPLDIVLSKKIGHPENPEYAIGAVSLDTEIIDRDLDIPDSYIYQEIQRIKQILRQRYDLFESQLEMLQLKDRDIILVDDGIATGSTLLVCISMIRKFKPSRVIVAVPVIPADRVNVFKKACDQLIFLHAPDFFSAVGEFYKEFNQVEDEEVIRLLRAARNH